MKEDKKNKTTDSPITITELQTTSMPGPALNTPYKLTDAEINNDVIATEKCVGSNAVSLGRNTP
ncbi:MAG: hypothetical protein ACI93R_004045 [Flavobacteriales bacterium]|jgi:hypothetical protein